MDPANGPLLGLVRILLVSRVLVSDSSSCLILRSLLRGWVLFFYKQHDNMEHRKMIYLLKFSSVIFRFIIRDHSKNIRDLV